MHLLFAEEAPPDASVCTGWKSQNSIGLFGAVEFIKCLRNRFNRMIFYILLIITSSPVSVTHHHTSTLLAIHQIVSPKLPLRTGYLLNVEAGESSHSIKVINRTVHVINIFQNMNSVIARMRQQPRYGKKHLESNQQSSRTAAVRPLSRSSVERLASRHANGPNECDLFAITARFSTGTFMSRNQSRSENLRTTCLLPPGQQGKWSTPKVFGSSAWVERFQRPT